MPTQDEMERCKWEQTSQKYIWRCLDTGKYHFQNEVEMLDTEEFDTIADALKALNEYVIHCL